MTVKEDPGDVTYVIWIYGLAPSGIVPSQVDDYLEVTIPIFAPEGSSILDPTPVIEPSQNIPSWIKNNAGWWAEGAIDDNSFVQGIQFLIKEGIMQIPPTSQGSGSSTNEIPSWIKNNAGWWAEGAIDDKSFVQGIQFLIKEGIMQIPSTAQGSGSVTNEIPSWIKNNAGWWAEGAIDDDSFVGGIQFLIEEGIMSISS